MLPATLQFLITMIACAINERMQRKLDYTQEEVRVLKEIVAVLTGNGRLSFTADQRRRLAVAGKALSPEERKKCCQIVKPGTILGWFRQMAARKYDSSESKVGRPRKRKDIRKLVVEMALANLGWGYTKIRDALRTGLKIEIGRTTVANMLLEEGIEPAPERERKRTWKRFMKSHWDTLCACDFFSVEALGAFGTVRYMVFFVIELKSRDVEIMGIAVDPGEEWMKQVARNLTDPVDGFLRGAKYLIHDRDPLFSKAFIAILKAGGVKSVPPGVVKCGDQDPSDHGTAVAGSKRFEIDVTLFDILMKSANFALHEHVPALGRSVGADCWAFEDTPDMPQMNERRILISQGHNCGLIYLTVALDGVAAEHAEKRWVGFKHRWLELAQLLDHSIAECRAPFGRIRFFGQEEIGLERALLHAQIFDLARKPHASWARKDRLTVIAQSRRCRSSMQLPRGGLARVPPLLAPDVGDGVGC
jgi:hypothetical protein